MRARPAVVALLAACGRIGFDARDDAGAVAGDGASESIPPGAGIWLQMETDPAVDIIDSAGGHAASCASCPTRVAGEHGQGYRFATNLVTVAYAADLAPNGGFTAAVWANLDAYPSFQGVLWAKPAEDSGGDTFTMFVDNTGTLSFDCDDFGGTGHGFSPGSFPLHEWHHLAAVYDGSRLHGFFDGTEIGANDATCDSMPASFDLGGEGSDLFSTAIVDDAVYYTRVLSDAEIAQLARP